MTCAISDCDRAVFNKKHGMCNMHYQRWLKGSDMHKPAKASGGTVRDRFESFVEIFPSSECITWPASRGTRGYGQLVYQNKTRKAHRVSYEIHVGPIPRGMVVRHKCDNPPCVNPAHLEIGTQSDNVSDAVERGRWRLGESSHRSKVTESQVLEIRELAKTTPLTVLSSKFGLDESSLSRIVNRKTWRHI